MNWREIVVGVIDEDEEFGEPLDPPLDYTLGQLVDEMRALGSGPERAAWFRAKDTDHAPVGVEWDGVIESIVDAFENPDRYVE